MFVAKNINAGHKDLIHDVAYDFHGKRMATCSSDQTVKVWDMKDNEWHCTATWKAHCGSVWRISWAFPEYGQVIATCSFDRTAVIWEECAEPKRGQWLKKATLVDSRTSVTDVKFAPKDMGLQLATCSGDGMVRIYEAPDVMNLNQWNLQHEIDTKMSCSSLSWNSSRMHPPMIVVGSDDPTAMAPGGASGKVQIFEFSDSQRKWLRAEVVSSVTSPVRDVAFAPNLGRSYHLLAIGAKELSIVSLKPLTRPDQTGNSTGVTKYEMRLLGQFDSHNSQVWRVCWNVTGTVLSSSGDDGKLRLWKANYLKWDNWKCVAVMQGDGTLSSTQSEDSIPEARGDSIGRVRKVLQSLQRSVSYNATY